MRSCRTPAPPVAPRARRLARKPDAMAGRRSVAGGSCRALIRGHLQDSQPARLAARAASGTGRSRGVGRGGGKRACAESSRGAAESPSAQGRGSDPVAGGGGQDGGGQDGGGEGPRSGATGGGTAAAPSLYLMAKYSIGGGDCTCSGIKVGSRGFREYMLERVGPRRTDAEGIKMVEKVLDGLDLSKFESPALGHLRSPVRMPDDSWRVGEALAECYQEDYEDAWFPHPRLRYERNPYAVSAGPDLVGYAVHGGDVMFLFGEVKTTGSAIRPPGAVRSLRVQLESLLGGQGPVHLIQNLLKMAAAGADEQEAARSDKALRSYAERRWKVAGVLISDQEPDRADLEAAFAALEKAAVSGGKVLRLVALYVPVPADSLGRPAGKEGAE